MTYSTRNVIQVLGHVWSGYQKEPWFSLPPNHCIEGTRIAVETLESFDIEAFPLAVDLALWNYENGVMVSTSDAVKQEIMSQGRVNLIDGGGEDTLMGHVVAWIPEMKASLDLSFGQFRHNGAFAIPNVIVLDGEPQDGQWLEWDMTDGSVLNVRPNRSTATDTLWRHNYDNIDVSQPVDMLLDDVLEFLEVHAGTIDTLSS